MYFFGFPNLLPLCGAYFTAFTDTFGSRSCGGVPPGRNHHVLSPRLCITQHRCNLPKTLRDNSEKESLNRFREMAILSFHPRATLTFLLGYNAPSFPKTRKCAILALKSPAISCRKSLLYWRTLFLNAFNPNLETGAYVSEYIAIQWSSFDMSRYCKMTAPSVLCRRIRVVQAAVGQLTKGRLHDNVGRPR